MEAIKSIPEKHDVPEENPSAPQSFAAQMRALPAAFSLAQPVKENGFQMPAGAYTMWDLLQDDTNH